MEIRSKLESEITNLEDRISGMDVSSDEYLRGTQILERLYKMKIDEDIKRMELEQNEKFKNLDMHDKRINRVVDTSVKILEVAVPASIYVGCFMVGLKFEESGMIKSDMVKKLTNLIKPKK